jgi:hypothetical protein
MTGNLDRVSEARTPRHAPPRYSPTPRLYGIKPGRPPNEQNTQDTAFHKCLTRRTHILPAALSVATSLLQRVVQETNSACLRRSESQDMDLLITPFLHELTLIIPSSSDCPAQQWLSLANSQKKGLNSCTDCNLSHACKSCPDDRVNLPTAV